MFAVAELSGVEAILDGEGMDVVDGAVRLGFTEVGLSLGGVEWAWVKREVALLMEPRWMW